MKELVENISAEEIGTEENTEWGWPQIGAIALSLAIIVLGALK